MQDVISCRRAVAVLLAALVVAPAAPASAADTYAKRCQDQSKQRSAGAKQSSFARCVTAMRRLAEAKTRSPRTACSALPRKRDAGSTKSPFSRCVKAGTSLIRHGNGIDRAFVDELIRHHKAAVDMANLAKGQGQSELIRGLASSIVTTQNAEASKLRKMSAKLKAAGIKSRSLGLSPAEMGRDNDVSKLAGASPFDMRFVDVMIAHHQAAMTMAGVLFKKGVDKEARQLAEDMTNTQRQEIQIMRDFRAQVYGSSGHPVSDPPH